MDLQIILTYIVSEKITVQLTSCFSGFDSAALIMFNYQQSY